MVRLKLTAEHNTRNPSCLVHTWLNNAAPNLRQCSVTLFFQVKTLKPLSTLKLQQLINLMEEESFANEEYIATEGEMGEKFFIIVHGSVSACQKTSVLVLDSFYLPSPHGLHAEPQYSLA